MLVDGNVLGAVSVSGSTNWMRGEYFEEDLSARLLEIINMIELNVTYT